jgi:hypothetical protein
MQLTTVCDQAVSNNSIVIISAELVISTQPIKRERVCWRNNTMSVTVSGGSGAITYQWQQSAMTDQQDGLNATGTGATTANLYPSSAAPGTTYYRVLVNAAIMVVIRQ